MPKFGFDGDVPGCPKSGLVGAHRDAPMYPGLVAASLVWAPREAPNIMDAPNIMGAQHRKYTHNRWKNRSMKYNPEIHQRRSIRLKGYDYSQAGVYFMTICTQGHKCLFGGIADGAMQLNETGWIVRDSWTCLAQQYDHVDLDEWVIMPNHLHGIIVLSGRDASRQLGEACKGASRGAPTGTDEDDHTDTPPKKSKPIGGLLGVFKTISTKKINTLSQTPGNQLWQRNFWERIVRDESELNRFREYIQNNPLKWELDRLHPDQSNFYKP